MLVMDIVDDHQLYFAPSSLISTVNAFFHTADVQRIFKKVAILTLTAFYPQ